MNDTWEGSGKWTKESFPEVQMRVSLGRIDFANLGGASGMAGETMLMGRYLDKLHNYRTRNLSWQWDEAIYDRAAVYSHESNSQADIQVYLAQWRAASALVPNQSGIKVRDALFSSSLPYCWGFVFGPGSFRTISSRRYPEAIVHTSEQLKLVVNEARSPFWWIRASYMGDYNSYGYESAKPSNNDSTVKDWNYLRSLLTLGEYGLAVVWNGKDIQSWRLDAFALGDPLGAAQRRMVSNFTLGTEGLNSHLELVIHGDPTLRMHTLNAPTGLSGTRSAGDSISLTWTALAGLKYHVYAFNLATQTFDRVTVQPIQGGGFIFTNTSQTFMVRGLKLQQVGAGSYYKISPGTQTSIP